MEHPIKAAINSPHTEQWALSIGKLVLNFAAIELHTYWWLGKLSGDKQLAVRALSCPFKKRVDHRRYNGATLLGLKGVVIKSHGSADVFSFNNALKRAAQEARSGVLARISERIALQQQQSQETEQTCMPASPV